MIATVAAIAALSVTLQGDSLTAGSGRYTAADLPNRIVHGDAGIGRGTQEAIRRLNTQRPWGRVVVFALGTNDDPHNVTQFRDELRYVRHEIGKRRCLVMATVIDAWHPYYALNRVIRREADVVVPWAEAMEHGKVQSNDGTHPGTDKGWRLRGSMIARGVHRCGRP